jgi:hypothetical protein
MLPAWRPRHFGQLEQSERAAGEKNKRHKVTENVTKRHRVTLARKRHQTSQSVTNRHNVTLTLFRI